METWCHATTDLGMPCLSLAGRLVLMVKWKFLNNENLLPSDAKCSELGCACIPLAVETYGCWGAESRVHLSRLASHLVAGLNSTKSQATFKLYSRLNLVLVEANARALLSRTGAYGNGSDPV
ncbi:hypothetical protein EMCRGX_G016851 [Ephydatia muelleri]